MLFDAGDGAMLCWLCNSRRKAVSETGPSREEEEADERRTWQRYPVQMHIKFYYGKSENSKIIFPGTTVNLSMGGMCIEWTPCEQCAGYIPGGVHPDCIFSRYSYAESGSEDLLITLFLSETDEVTVYSRVVFVIKQEDGTEYIGASFVNNEPETMKKIEEIINQIAQYG
jgi:hypothetical protein